MNPTTRIIQPLQRLAATGRVRAWLKTIDDPTAAATRRQRAADGLLGAVARGDLTPDVQAGAVEGLLLRWDRLPASRRERLMKISPARLRVGLVRVMSGSSGEGRLVVAALAQTWPRAEFIRAAASLVTDADDRVAATAEDTLLAVASSAADLKGDDEAAFDLAVTGLARGYPEHRRPAVLRAVTAVLDRPGPHLRAWLREGADAEMMPLRSALRKSEGVSRVSALRLLGTPSLAAAAAERLLLPATAADHEATLALGPLVGVRGRAAALKRVDDPIAMLPAQAELERLSLEARLGAASWAASLPVTSVRRAHALVPMLSDPEPIVRASVVRRLGELAVTPGPAREALHDAVFDRDPRVARAALLELQRVDPGLASRCATTLCASAHAEMRTLAGELLGARDAWALLGSGDAAAWPLWRDLLDTDPLRTRAALRGRVAEGEPAERCLAIQAVRRLELGAEIEQELLSAARDPSERVASSAVTALGDLVSPASRASVSASLAHPDGRVRANAVEAIARRDPDEPVVRAWVTSDTPRARGNAVRARLVLARDAGGAEALSRMLTDDRRGHRLSGLWVAERAGMTSVSERVAEIARTESEPHVRERARRCARRLLAEMRLRESGPVAASGFTAVAAR